MHWYYTEFFSDWRRERRRGSPQTPSATLCGTWIEKNRKKNWEKRQTVKRRENNEGGRETDKRERDTIIESLSNPGGKVRPLRMRLNFTCLSERYHWNTPMITGIPSPVGTIVFSKVPTLYLTIRVGTILDLNTQGGRNLVYWPVWRKLPRLPSGDPSAGTHRPLIAFG